EPFQERRRYVVWKISGDMEFAGREVEYQSISLDNLHVFRQVQTESRDQIRVDFNRNHTMSRSSEMASERSPAGSNFNDGIVQPDISELHDAAQDGGIRQEMLAEAFLQEIKAPHGWVGASHGCCS